MGNFLSHWYRLGTKSFSFVFQRIEDTPEGQIQRELRRTDESPREEEMGRDVITARLEALFSQSVLARYPNSRLENVLYLGRDNRGRDIFMADLLQRERAASLHGAIFYGNGRRIRNENEIRGEIPSFYLTNVFESDNHQEIQRHALRCLSFFNSSGEAREVVQSIATNNTNGMRLEAIRMLGKFPGTLATLERFAQSNNQEEKFAACMAWAEMGNNFSLSNIFVDALASLPPMEIAVVLQAYWEGSNAIRQLLTTEWCLWAYDNAPEGLKGRIALEICRRPLTEVGSVYLQKIMMDPTVRNLLSENIDWVFHSDFFDQLQIGLRNYPSADPLSCVNVFSVAIAVTRLRLERRDINLSQGINHILAGRDFFAHHEIFNPHTHVILFGHEREEGYSGDFGQSIYANLAQRSGVPRNQIERFQGAGRKEAILESVQHSRGKTTIVFTGHGLDIRLGLARRLDFSSLDGLVLGAGISIEEFADALIASGNTENITILFTTCFSYDFVRNLIRRLEARQVTIPIMISFATKDRAANGGVIFPHLRYLSEGQTQDEPLRGKDFLKLETYMFTHDPREPNLVGNDLGFFIPTEDIPALYLGASGDSSYIEVSQRDDNEETSRKV